MQKKIERHVKRLKKPFRVRFLKINGEIRVGTFKEPVFYAGYFKAVDIDKNEPRTISFDRVLEVNSVAHRKIWRGKPLGDNTFEAEGRVWRRVGTLFLGARK